MGERKFPERPRVGSKTHRAMGALAASEADWRHRAECKDENPELFFPLGNTGPALMQTEEAKEVCRRCDVREQCLAWALENKLEHGVWGGMSEDERKALKRRSRNKS